MLPSSPRLELFVPGLFSPQPAVAALPPGQRPDWRSLETRLARADRQRGPAGSVTETLARSLGLTGPSPLAAVTAAADGLPATEGWWLRADPVSLIPDRDRLRLVDPAPELTMAEAGELVAALNAFLADEGFTIVAPHPRRWYVRCGSEPSGGSPLPEVAGEDIAAHLPDDEGGAWRRRLNEIQMSLHGHPVNAAREAQGRLPVNSVWFWGGGRWPEATDAGFRRIFTDDAMLAALFTALGSEPQPSSALATAELSGHDLVVDTRLWPANVRQDPLDWMQKVTEFHDTTMTAAIRRMQADKLTLHLFDETGNRFILHPRQRVRLWRRPRSLAGLTTS